MITQQQIDEVLRRGVSEVVTYEELETRLKSGKKIKIKFGIDPSGKDLHLGHMVAIRKLKQFQDLGHKIILIIGNFTGQIGDPTGKLEARKQKTKEEIQHNASTYIKQIGKVLDTKKIDILWNADWLEKLSLKDAIKLAANFTVSKLLERDMFQERISVASPIYLHEFIYPILQAYDSVIINADVEIGGTDQTFNLLCGRDLQRAVGQTPQCILTVPILEGTDGKIKMGKTTDNYIGIMESPGQIYGKIMSIPDNLIVKYFELTTNIPLKEIKKIEKSLIEGENPRNLKMRLAYELVRFYHSDTTAQQAQENFIRIFQKKEIPSDIQTVKFSQKKWNIVNLLNSAKVVSSKSEARRLVTAGAVEVNGKKMAEDKVIDITKGCTIKVGKRKFIKIALK